MRLPYIVLFRSYVAPRWRQAALLALLLAGSIALQLLDPLLLRSFIDAAIAGAPIDALAITALAFVGIALVIQVLAAASQYVGESLGWAATNELRADLTHHLLQLDLGFHKARTPGELIERVDGDATSLAGFFSRFIVNVLGNAVLLVGVLVMVAREDIRAGLALLAFAALAILVMVGPLRTVAVRRWRDVREISAQMFGFLGEYLAGTEDVRSSGAERHVLNGLALQHRAMFAARRRAVTAMGAIVASTTLTFAVGNATAFAIGGYLWSVGAITLGTVYLIFHYTDMLRRPIDQLRRELEDMQRAVASVTRVHELRVTRSALTDGPIGRLPDGALALEIDRVSFAYGPSEPLVLQDLSLRVAGGRTVGLLGRTGSGKTTLARLLMRFHDPTAGQVRVGGVDLRDSVLEEVRRRVTLVSQDVQLFHASVRDNVTFFDRTVADDRVREVLEHIGLGHWLRARHAGGSDGLTSDLVASGISAGEAQLLAFARVFLRDPSVVILDEASSRLDPATQRLIERAVDTLLERRTAVVIAHRLATVQRCDEIVILEDGRIVEQGTRIDLAEDPGSRFAGLLRGSLAEMLA